MIREQSLAIIYIVAAEETIGRTAISAGIAINLLNAGKKVGYLKPGARSDDDINFMKQISGLKIIDNETDALKSRDIVLIEAILDNQTSRDIKEKKAKVIAVEACGGQVFKSARAYKEFGEDFLGVIINKAPASQVKRIKAEAAEIYGAGGIKVLGIIPENRMLLAITVGEVAECIGGKILNQSDKSGELVENYMLGAMVVDSGLDYFGRKKNKAAVLRQERLDMQLAALETSTRCLVLSGGDSKPPTYSVLYKAESKGIPIITTGAGVDEIVTSIDNAIVKSRLNQTNKLTKLAETVQQNLDMKVFG
jgi:BioD-like phosphotransacetylase family protein